jgi:Negative regulator of sigma F
MTTSNNLIQQLSQDLKPVRLQAQFLIRFWSLLFLNVMITVAGVLYWYFKKNEFNLPLGRSFIESVLLLVTAFFCSYYMTKSLSPHTAKAKTSFRPMISFFMWCLLLIGAFIMLYLRNPLESLEALQYNTWLCPTVALSIGLPISIVSVVWVKNGVSLFPQSTFLYWSVMSLSWGALGLSLICPWTDPLHEILWHVLPVLIVTSCLFLISKCLYALYQMSVTKKY